MGGIDKGRKALVNFRAKGNHSLLVNFLFKTLTPKIIDQPYEVVIN